MSKDKRPDWEASLGPAGTFSQAERDAVYRAIYERRDVRDEFLDAEVPRETVMRILDAAHHAPSVGFMQPWNFILVRDRAVRENVAAAFAQGVRAEEQVIAPERRELYRDLKLQGILKAPLNICVTCDRARHGTTGLGRSLQPNTDLLSTACAVQNLWLAARVEGLASVGEHHARGRVARHSWDSEEIAVVAYLCVGYIERAYSRPELEAKRWARRLALDDLVFDDRWGARSTSPTL